MIDLFDPIDDNTSSLSQCATDIASCTIEPSHLALNDDLWNHIISYCKMSSTSLIRTCKYLHAMLDRTIQRDLPLTRDTFVALVRMQDMLSLWWFTHRLANTYSDFRQASSYTRVNWSHQLISWDLWIRSYPNIELRQWLIRMTLSIWVDDPDKRGMRWLKDTTCPTPTDASMFHYFTDLLPIYDMFISRDNTELLRLTRPPNTSIFYKLDEHCRASRINVIEYETSRWLTLAGTMRHPWFVVNGAMVYQHTTGICFLVHNAFTHKAHIAIRMAASIHKLYNPSTRTIGTKEFELFMIKVMQAVYDD